MNYELQVFRFESGTRNSRHSYRFAVLDYSKAQEYPLNFVCMLPIKIESIKGKSLNNFGTLFGEKSEDFAIQLLEKALLSEKDVEVRVEIEKRLKLLNPQLSGNDECSACKKIFKISKKKKYKQPFCKECYQKRCARSSVMIC
jgi:hypothetical protein